MEKTQKDVFEETINKLKEVRDECDTDRELRILKKMTDELPAGPAKDFFQRISEKIEESDKLIKKWLITSTDFIGGIEQARKLYQSAYSEVKEKIQSPDGIPHFILLTYKQILLAHWLPVRMTEMAGKQIIH